MKFEKERCLKNIYFLAKKKGIKIGDIEEKAGVSSGYISRINKEENRTSLNIDFLIIVAEYLKVSLESLLVCDYTVLSVDEERVVNFINKIYAETLDYNNSWIKEAISDLTKLDEHNGMLYPRHPLMSYDSAKDEEEYEKAYYKSKIFTDIKAEITEIYRLDINETVEIYVMNVTYHVSSKKTFNCYELHMKKANNVGLICYGEESSDLQFTQLLKSLIEAASISASQVHLSEDMRNFMDDYINGNVPTGEDWLDILTDGDLPF